MRTTPGTLAIALAAAVASAGVGTPAQSPPPPDLTIDPFGIGAGPAPGVACARAEYRQFDFWVGSWEVVTPAGAPSGVNVVSRELGGCAVEERWTDASGGRGRSLNAYDPAGRRWHQHWVFAAGGPGSVVHYAGRLAQGRMVMGGMRTYANGVRIQDLGVWTPLTADSVRQEFYALSSDTTSPNLFDGRYRRRPSVTPAAERAFPSCGGRPRNRELDFTIGSWDVRVESAPAGRSEIRPDLSHCLLEERVTGRTGHAALAYAAYSPVSERWELTRADTRGTRLFLEGGAGPPAADRVVMRGRSPLPGDGATTLRVTWERVDATSFRQRWERSGDGGASWTPLLVATYSRRRT